jgi:hypothetical protein
MGGASPGLYIGGIGRYWFATFGVRAESITEAFLTLHPFKFGIDIFHKEVTGLAAADRTERGHRERDRYVDPHPTDPAR